MKIVHFVGLVVVVMVVLFIVGYIPTFPAPAATTSGS